MKGYIKGFLRNVLNPGVGLFSFVDDLSVISDKSKVKRFSRIINSKIDEFSYVDSSCSVLHTHIGKFCSIGSDTHIGIPEHSLKHLSTSPIFTESLNSSIGSFTDRNFFHPFKPVIIGNDVWIGREVIIKGGVRIGDGAVIGAKSLVTKDVEPYSIVGGVPAKVLKYRFSPEIIDYLLNIKWWDFDVEFIKSNIDIFQSNDLNIEKIDFFFKNLNK